MLNKTEILSITFHLTFDNTQPKLLTQFLLRFLKLEIPLVCTHDKTNKVPVRRRFGSMWNSPASCLLPQPVIAITNEYSRILSQTSKEWIFLMISTILGIGAKKKKKSFFPVIKSLGTSNST